MDNQSNGLSLKSTGTVTLFSIIALGIGFILQIVLASRFGTNQEMDAYWAALSIPALLNTVFIGVLNISLVPVFIEYKTKQSLNDPEKNDVWKISSSFFNLLFLILTIITLSGIWGAPLIVRFTAPGFMPGTPIYNLTVTLLRILFPSVLFTGLSAVLASLYNANRSFTVPAAMPVLSSISILIVTLTFSTHLGILSVAIGTLTGAVMQLLMTLPIFLKNGRYRLSIHLTHKSTIKIIKLMLPWIAGAMISKANPVFDRFVASSMPEGSISYLGYAYTVLLVSTTLVSKGISMVLFPILSKQATEKNWQYLKESTFQGVAFIHLFVWPVIIFMLFFRIPIIQLLFQRGAFSAEAVVATGNTWLAYTGAFAANSMGTVLTYAFYAMQDTTTAVKVGVLGFLLNITLTLILSSAIGYLGPALAFSIVSVFNFVCMLILLDRRLKVAIQPNAERIMKPFQAAVLTIGGMWLIKFLLADWWQPVSMPQQILYVFLGGTFCLALYLMALAIVKANEIFLLIQLSHKLINQKAKITALNLKNVNGK